MIIINVIEITVNKLDSTVSNMAYISLVLPGLSTYIFQVNETGEYNRTVLLI